MKELSIEEKAKAYDDLLVKLQKAKVDNDVCDERYCCVIDDIVPELAESEDESVRKEIFEYCYKRMNNEFTSITIHQIERWIPWLEKQGEHANFRNKIQIGDKVTRNDNGELVNMSQLQRVAKPCEKVEPKFHKGEWLCENEPNYYARFIQILETVNVQGKERYRISRDIHNDEDIVEFDFVEKYYHRFNIKDAKDGDVLVASDDSIFLFKGTVDLACKHYVALTTDNTVKFNEGLKHYWEVSRAVHPATKEQRDLLFQKMREAGYEWDTEKKELKKIEQNHAWSEEDEEYYNSIIGYLKYTITNGKPETYKSGRFTDWLKNLKDRMQPQNTWKPSDEQMNTLWDAIVFVEGCNSNFKGSGSVLENLYNDLKKLRKE